MRAVWIVSVLALAGCADLPEVESLSEQDVAEDAARLDAVPQDPDPQDSNAKGGFFSRLLGQPSNTAKDTSSTLELAGDDPTTSDQEFSVASDDVQQETDTDPQPVAAAAKPERKGLMGLFTRNRSDDRHDTVITASLDPDSAQRLDTPATTSKGTATLSDLSYGAVAKNCGINRLQLGKRVAKFPEKRPKYAIYDSKPGATGPRPHFVTGFSDGCVRQFTASLAVFGSVGMHESLRYGLPADIQPYSETDRAYEKLKSKVCRVPRRKPCGAKISRLERNTVFLSVYERFGSNPTWTNLLLHDGQIMASAKVVP